ncbi:MAG TPA: LysR family transcriptional regulator [Streptosporangiaceae bacterium]|jgi:DNA-binding transcriptional LysR family regulator
MELDQLEAFLVLAEELHFGRTAARLHVAQSRVSRQIAALEREVGERLFVRTSRRVELTALGAGLLAELVPAHAALRRAVRNAQVSARGITAALRIGCTVTTGGYQLNRLVKIFESRYPQWPVMVSELPFENPFKMLVSGDVDVLAHWVMGSMPGIELGPVVATSPRVLAVAVDSPLAAETAVSAEVLADWPVPNLQPLDERVRNLFIPQQTPSGRPVQFHPAPISTMSEMISLVARGIVVHPTIASVAQVTHGQEIALVPINDLPPLKVGLYWAEGNTDDRIRALIREARSARLPASRGPDKGSSVGKGPLMEGTGRLPGDLGDGRVDDRVV